MHAIQYVAGTPPTDTLYPTYALQVARLHSAIEEMEATHQQALRTLNKKIADLKKNLSKHVVCLRAHVCVSECWLVRCVCEC